VLSLVNVVIFKKMYPSHPHVEKFEVTRRRLGVMTEDNSVIRNPGL
jgi:hypothetical protein